MSTYTIADISVKQVGFDNVWQWLARGWTDLWSRPGLSLGYGLFVTLLSYALIGCLYYFNLVYLLLPLAAAFMFGGPLLAVGLYEMSRRFDEGVAFRPRAIIGAVRRAPPPVVATGPRLPKSCTRLWQ